MSRDKSRFFSLFPIILCTVGTLLSPTAFAQDGWLDDEEEKKEEATPTEGSDTAEIYRAAVKEYKISDAEDEILLWQEYLAKYPNTQFRIQIDKRLEELETKLYTMDPLDDEEAEKEKGKQELDFAQPLLLENIDPRKKLRFAFEMGLPNYINLLVDYEYPLRRELSVHGGLRKRYTGWSMEGGVKYALSKSVRTQSLVTVLGDIRVNTLPFFVGLRPQISAGKIFNINNFRVDVMGQLGTELQSHSLQGVLIGGFHIGFVASQTVRIYVEGNTYMKDFFWNGKPFSFNTITFGMKFRKKPSKNSYGQQLPNKFEGGIGTTIPAHYSYWRYHYGSITGDVNIY